jgi:DNA polymerase
MPTWCPPHRERRISLVFVTHVVYACALPIKLHLDFETASRVDLKVRGLDNYAKDPSTHVLMLAFAHNDAPPQMWFPHEGPLPEYLELELRRPEIRKSAYNADFERTILREVLHIDTPARVWSDPMIQARYASIAGNLEFVGKVLGLPADKAKLMTGKKLIRFFCVPNKAGEFNTHLTHPAEFAEFTVYCRQDVVAEREIGKLLKAFELPPLEKRIFALDQEINARGLPVDMDFVRKASKIVEEERADLTKEFVELTGLDNPNSVSQLLEWLKTKGYPYGSLGKKWVDKALSTVDVTEALCRRGLELRQLLAKSSTAKLQALLNLTGPDGRLRNSYSYGGAARTLRWSGRGFQPQNISRPTIKDVTGATAAILTGDREAVRTFGPPLDAVVSCLRGALCAPPGKQFVVCDLSSIEVVVLGWLVGCSSILKVFEDGRDPYVQFATMLYGLPYDQITKEQRQISKPPVLGCGYGLGGGDDAIDKNGDAIRTGLWGYSQGMGVETTREQAHEAVELYRNAYPEIPRAWRKWENAAIAAVRTGEKQTVGGNITFGCVKGKLLWIALPSGRRLSYVRPRLETEEGFGSDKLSYEGQIIGAHWGRIHTWGGKFAEQLTQATARDVLAEGMLRATAAGFTICGHSHDEIIALEDVGSPLNLTKLREAMITRPTWGPDLVLNADGYCAERYRK